MLITIKFTTYGSSPLVGGFKPGDLARVPASTAAHMVDEARCAEYLPAPASAPSGELLQSQPATDTKPTARRPRRATGDQQ